MSIGDENVSWKRIEQQLAGDEAEESSLPSLPQSSTSPPDLKSKLTAADKITLTEKLQNFKKLHKDDFWVLDATMRQAEVDDVEPISVEEKVMAFALGCEYYHPSQSLILDLGDKNWSSVFSEEDLDEIRGAGGDLPCGVPKELEQCFKSLKELKTGAEVFKYARSIEITDPTKETLKVLIESDQLYRCFDFFATVFKGSSILAKGTEKSSEANATSVNQDRTLSAIKLIANRKMERRVDMLFNCGHIEFGCTEIGATKDQTKEMRDSFLKMPIVLRDMLLLATFRPNLLHQSHVIGYSISALSVFQQQQQFGIKIIPVIESCVHW
ncbi:hypothetical protein BDB00DRAFT_939777 [Zychaea mexicana]|uniref:uncharacterized protein n=1 Tax=Zychaea mexicana TaxID=64656 RepID=UPI0022FE8028|nr:uncharacterized protein BDB00DRAFT_939775 [Zychaea mexicana]XP_052978579.1 uncharacterized protein BDB00DRAFT_939777 [Zychaea mexicana]KAI9492312.1 hypothetical protein BDB00DRAFT_939775 [Zychaea mexicana]KAI9492314.1 hypothetical protein BDB00DRAFT_939777 [Zychaea mexicana]